MIPSALNSDRCFSLILVKYSDRLKVGENVEQKGIKEGVPEPSYMRECVFMPAPTLSLQGDLITGCQGSSPPLGYIPLHQKGECSRDY